MPLGTQSLARNGEIVEGSSQARGKKVAQKCVALCTVRCVGTRCDVVIIGWKGERRRFFLSRLANGLVSETLVCLRVYNRKQRKLKYNIRGEFNHRSVSHDENEIEKFS